MSGEPPTVSEIAEESKCSGNQAKVAKEHKPFDLGKVRTLLENALVDGTTIDLKCYCDAWHELVKFLDTLGTLFHFVTHDVKSKLTTIEEFMSDDIEHYRFINSTLQFEVTNEIVVTKKLSCTRTIQRIHRALLYLITFFDKLVNAPANAKCSTLSREAYNDTLSKYHPWIVKKAANLAMHTLPLRNVLLERIDGQPDNEQRVTKLLQDIIHSGRPIYDLTQQLYDENSIGDLP